MARPKRSTESIPPPPSSVAGAEQTVAPVAPAVLPVPPPGPIPATRDVAPRNAAAADGIGTAATATATAACKPLDLTIEVVWGDILAVDVPVVVIGEYLNVPSHGATLAVDKASGWGLRRVLEMGLTNCRLGKLFFYPLGETDGTKLKAGAILLAGMGEPGRFGRDDLTLLMANVTVAIGLFDFDRFGMVMLGTSRGGLPMDRALRALLEGVADGIAHLPPDGRPAAMTITLVEDAEDRYTEIKANLQAIQRQQDQAGAGIEGIALTVLTPTPQWDPVASSLDSQPDDDQPPQSETNRITVTTLPESNRGVSPTEVVYEFSALSESAAIPVRDQVVQSYFVQRMSPRLMASATAREQQMYGRLLANYVLPEDFLRFLDSDLPVTLVVDNKTAEIPWEMAALKGRRGPIFLGGDLQLARQFRTLNAAAPGIAPPRNNKLSVLIIADPSPSHPLPGARREGLAVASALALAESAWRGSLELTLTLRIGPSAVPDQLTGGIKADVRAALDALDDADVRAALAAIPNFDRVFGRDPGAVPSLGPCDPLEILALLLNERFDVVHYAGHGVYDPTGSKGWLFDDGCILSASEIFKVRQVPRLVFANACHSARTDAPTPATAATAPATAAPPKPVSMAEAQVSLAEAFFSRGISNYIGAGWPVGDADATEFARRFYLQALGVVVRPSGMIELCDAAPPDTLGMALATARRALMNANPTHPGTTWGAYQHYGDVNDKLLAFTNSDVQTANKKDRHNTSESVSPSKPEETTGEA